MFLYLVSPERERLADSRPFIPVLIARLKERDCKENTPVIASYVHTILAWRVSEGWSFLKGSTTGYISSFVFFDVGPVRARSLGGQLAPEAQLLRQLLS